MKSGTGLISSDEIALTRECLDYARKAGADAVRICLSKSVQNSISVLDGKMDKVSYSADRSLCFHLFSNGRYGAFSTNRLERTNLEKFIKEALDTVRVLSPDPCRCLPDKKRKAAACSEGDELELFDPEFFSLSLEDRTALAVASCRYPEEGDGWKTVSVEAEYSDSLDDCFLTDSDGFEGRHCETAFGMSAEATVADAQGRKSSGYWWRTNPKFSKADISDICSTAVEKAASMTGDPGLVSGRQNVIIDPCCASRLVAPLLSALDGQNIQQHNSFLEGTLGEKVFTADFTLIDDALAAGRAGSRLFDSEGVAVKEGPVIENGILRKYFINSYIARKMKMEGTVECVSRPAIAPFICNSDKKSIHLDDIMSYCADGLYITEFNGGNCNSATGNFSFGVAGFVFHDGKIGRPVREVLMTGDMRTLWNNLVAAGSDARECARWQIPTLAFRNVDLNA